MEGGTAGWQHNQFSELVQQRRRERERGRVIAKTTVAAAVSSGLQCIITVHSPSKRERGRRRSLWAKYETPLLSRHEASSRGVGKREREKKISYLIRIVSKIFAEKGLVPSSADDDSE